MNSLTQAVARNISKNPNNEVLYRAIELGHSSTTIQNLFYVDSPTDLMLGGQLYSARNLRIDFGSVAPNVAQTYTINIFDVSSEIRNFIEPTLQTLTPVTLSVRLFLQSTDRAAMIDDRDQFTVPYITTVSQVSIKNGVIELVSTLANLNSRNLHSQFLNSDDYISSVSSLDF